MSVARMALRIATVKALRGRTIAGEMVRDSEIGPIDDAAKDKEIPFVIVFTDDSAGRLVGPDTCSPNAPTVSLVIEIGVTTRMKSARPGWEIPMTDAGMEMTLDAIERQIGLALHDTDNAWAEFWRRLIRDGADGKSQRGAAAKDGVRFAGRQIVTELQIVTDPAPGKAPGPLWQEFLALCDADADLAPNVPLLTALVTGGATDWPQWKILRTVYGLPAPSAAALGVVPPAGTEEDSPTFAAELPEPQHET